MRTGGCLCGGVRYGITEELRPVVYCHCNQCRRTSGHFVAATPVVAEAFELLVNKSLEWFPSSDDAHRGFCRDCGSSLFWRPVHDDRISIMAGTLDDTEGLTAEEHIFVADKGCYYDLTDGLPQSPSWSDWRAM